MEKKAVLALDQGTTSSRAILFDQSGAIIAVAQREFPQHYPRNGWVEHHPAELWETQIATAREALHKSGLKPGEIAAIGVTNQRETTLLWDRKTGAPIAPAMVWQDRRTAPLCEALKAEGREEWFRAQTGLPLDPYFSGTKIAWLLDNVAGARRRAERGELAFGTVDSFLLWHLTGGTVHATDPTNASRTLLYNLHTGDWDDDLCAALNIPRSLLPHIVPSSGVIAHTNAALFGVPIPIAGIAGDQQAALFGQGCVAPGQAKNTYGTGCFLLLHTGDQVVSSTHGLLSTRAATVDKSPAFALEGSVFVGGAVVQWLRDELQIIQTSADSEALAQTVPDSGGVTFIPAFTGLGTPHWDPHARGAILGLTRGTGAAHIARAALEAIAFQSADALAAMEQDAQMHLAELRVDGGATANHFLMQFQADLLGVPVVRPRMRETTAWGAAALAGLAVGFWHKVNDLSVLFMPDRVFTPTMSRDEAQTRIAKWRRAVERVKGK